jgi:NitT/TauT family transport system ATP-binding protein
VIQKYLLDVYDASHKTVFFITHNLEEAIFLGTRVIVVTSRPARVKKVININIPRPRDFRVLSSEYYRNLKEEALEAVHEEAQKAFEAGERERA